MRTYKKDIPQLTIEKTYINDNLKEFLDYNGVNADIYIDNDRLIYNTPLIGGGYFLNIAMGYGGSIYFEKDGYPIWGQGASFGKIRIKKEDEKALEYYIDIYNEGAEYFYSLKNDKGEEVDTCGGFYSLEDIKECLPKEWKNENLKNYIVK